MRKIVTTLGALLALAIGSNGWGQSVFLKYGPVAGIQKSTGSTYQNTAAASADVIGLWGSTPSPCTASSFLRGDGNCAIPAGTGVTSVTVPAPLTATTCSGGAACAITWTTAQTANRILATPDATTGAVSLRALVAGDVPPINLGSTANGGVSSATILLGTNGGTSNGFFSVTGPTTALRTFTFPNASATVLTSNAAVTVAQGGTGLATLTANGVLLGEGTSNISPLVMGADTVLRGTASADPVAAAVPNCGSSTTALNYSTSTHAFGCQTISAGGTGTVTNVATGTGLTGGPITTTGTLSVDQTAALTWTALESFSNGVKSTGTGGFGGTVSLLASAAIPTLGWQAPANAADQKDVQCYYNGGALTLNCTFVNDAGSAEKSWMSITRGATTTVTGVAFGNATDVPSITGNGVKMTPVQGTFTMTYTGFTAGNSLTATYYCGGNMCTLIIPGSAVAASNATTFTATGVPAAIQPAQTQELGIYAGLCEDNSVIGGFTCGASIAGGTITFQKNNSGSGWTASNQKGITTNLTVSYILN